MTDHESEGGSGVENEPLRRQNLVPFRDKEDGVKESWQNLHLEQRCQRHVNRPVVGGMYPFRVGKSPLMHVRVGAKNGCVSSLTYDRHFRFFKTIRHTIVLFARESDISF